MPLVLLKLPLLSSAHSAMKLKSRSLSVPKDDLCSSLGCQSRYSAWRSGDRHQLTYNALGHPQVVVFRWSRHCGITCRYLGSDCQSRIRCHQPTAENFGGMAIPTTGFLSSPLIPASLGACSPSLER